MRLKSRLKEILFSFGRRLNIYGHIPHKLYKYRKWSNKHHRRLLTNAELYFASASNFNDPFDSNITINYSKGSKKEILGKYVEHIAKKNPGLSKTDRLKLAKSWMEKGIYNDPENIIKSQKSQIEKRLKEVGIVSLSEYSDDIIMWSHYADSHKGFCVGFDTNNLQRFKEQYKQLHEVLFNIYKVKYNKKYPTPSPFGTEEEVVIDPLRIKSYIWNYENEYRLISLNGSNQILQLTDEIISEVILGCQMAEPDIEDIIRVLSKLRKPIRLYKMEMKTAEFGLSKKEIAY
jgi:hypothetical protein